MIEEVKVSYQGENEYSQMQYCVESNSLPVLPRKGQIITICSTAGKETRVKVKRRTVRREGKILHVALHVLEMCNA